MYVGVSQMSPFSRVVSFNQGLERTFSKNGSLFFECLVYCLNGFLNQQENLPKFAGFAALWKNKNNSLIWQELRLR